MIKLIKNWWLLIAAIMILAIIYYLFADRGSMLPDVSGGLFVETIGAVITFVLIERVLKVNEERKRVRIEKAALKSFRFTIVDLLNLFWNMRRAGAEKRLDSPPSNWREAISSEAAINDITHLDFLSNAGIHPPMTWNVYVAQSFQNVHLPAIRRLIDTYAIFLSPELLEKLEALNGCELFSRIFLQAEGFSTIPNGPKKLAMLACMEDYLETAINNLLDLLDAYNKICHESKIEFSGLNLGENTKPLVGSGRIENPHDPGDGWKLIN